MKQPKKLLLTVLASYVIVLGVNVCANYPYYAAGNNWQFSVLFSMGFTTFCWLWFGLVNHLIFRRVKWTDRPSGKIMGASLVFAAEGAAMMWLVMKAMVCVFGFQEQSVADYANNCTYAALISMIIGLMVSGQRFLSQLKKSMADNELMQRAMAESQYEMLKSQVNPHFFFNSLNTLTVMIPRQPEMAVNFVEQMSKVFRYSLQHSGENTIDMATELKVVRSYLFLNEQRYDGKLVTEVKIDEAAMRGRIVTQSLLMLAENAIKHNELSHEKPLKLRICNEGNYLVVWNTLQRKTTLETSTRTGLENIKKRYSLATSVPVVISETPDSFIVKIPLL